MRSQELYQALTTGKPKAKSNARVVVLAPHPDDELIGCFSWLSAEVVDYVAYFHDITPTREAEALRCSERYGFTPLFIWTPDAVANLEDVMVGAHVLVPALTDAHPEHKALNSRYRQARGVADTFFYSVDMGVGKTILSEDQRDAKKRALDTLYSSQKQLWGTNASYYLFESIKDDDLPHFFRGMAPLALGQYVTYLLPSGTNISLVKDLASSCVTVSAFANALVKAGIYEFELESHGGGEVIRL